MKPLYITIFIVCFFVSIYSHAQSPTEGCGIRRMGSTCVGKVITFVPNCLTEGFTRFSWYIDGTLIETTESFPNTFAYTFTAPGNHTVKLGSFCGGCDIPTILYNEMNILIEDVPTPTITASAGQLCETGSVTLSVVNYEGFPTINYNWRSVPSGYSAQGGSVTFNNISTTTTFYVTASGESCTNESSSSVEVKVEKTELEPQLHPDNFYHRRVLTTSTSRINHYWEQSSDGTDMTHPVKGIYTVYESGDYYIRYYSGTLDCWTTAKGPLHVEVDYTPPLASVVQVQKAGYNEVYLSNDEREYILSYADYYWVDGAGENPTIVKPYNSGETIIGSKLYKDGTYYLKGRDRVTGTWGPTFTVSSVIRSDENLNWVQSILYDGTKTIVNGLVTEKSFSESKTYFDEGGKQLQTQTKSFTSGKIFAAQNLRDRYDRVVGSTLAAPINSSDFKYNAGFMLTSTGDVYDYSHFDNVYPDDANGSTKYNPAAIGNSEEGTLGWYYSEKNTLEPRTAKTFFPYNRSEFYEDGTGEIKKTADIGDVMRLGTGTEIWNGTFPVYHELDDYLARRGEALPGIVQSATLKEKGVQNIMRDQNGIYIVTITDQNGKSIMTARKGGSDVGQYSLSINNSVTSSGNPASQDFRKMTYFYILDAQTVGISGSGFYVEDFLNDIRKNPGQTFAGTDGLWPAGFYRVILTDESSTVTINYKNYFTDVSYQFYDDAGRLVSSVSPNGLAAWRSGINYSVIDKTTYEYNFRGLVKSMTEVDAGTARYIYRKDGKIRFSQNALQRENEINNQTAPNNRGKFSYTLYDDIGRPMESGEYIGEDQTYASQSENLEYSAQQSYEDEDKKDWVVTHYDTPDNNFAATGLGSIYSQKFLRGAVSVTENKNIITWYSYDELGRVIWMAQKPKALKRVFVVKYTYDFLGNVLTIANLAYDVAGNLVQQFYHHYEYDADKRLSRAYTSTDENGAKRLRASYKYYLHGPLKRIELGDNLQGIDFVYNIHGWLTHINHPDKAQDPGGDGNDVFGMLLDYYESDMVNLYTATYNTHSLTKIHGLAHIMQPSPVGYHPLIRIQFPSEFSDDALSGYNKYSAENPMYREQIGKLKNSLSDN